MISTTIDGSRPSNQLFDMLAVIANPDIYNARLKELQEATEKNQKYVELLAPASDIVSLQEKIRVESAESTKALEDARALAKKIVDEANLSAASAIQKATEEANDIVAEAKAMLSSAKSDQARAASLSGAAKKEREKYQALLAETQEEKARLEEKHAQADAMLADLAKQKAVIAAKHEVFLRELLA